MRVLGILEKNIVFLFLKKEIVDSVVISFRNWNALCQSII